VLAPVMLDPNLSVRQAAGDLVTPIGMAFLAPMIFWCSKRIPAKCSGSLTAI
jgi:hypothetical protein